MMTAAHDLTEIASDAAFAVDEGLQILAWNNGARQLLGYRNRILAACECQ